MAGACCVKVAATSLGQVKLPVPRAADERPPLVIGEPEHRAVITRAGPQGYGWRSATNVPIGEVTTRRSALSCSSALRTVFRAPVETV